MTTPQWVVALAWLFWPILFAAMLLVAGTIAVAIEGIVGIVCGIVTDWWEARP